MKIHPILQTSSVLRRRELNASIINRRQATKQALPTLQIASITAGSRFHVLGVNIIKGLLGDGLSLAPFDSGLAQRCTNV